MDQSTPVLTKQNKSVSFDDDHNEVHEFPRVSAENKPNVWLSRVQIRENKLQAQEEVMMEKTKEFVKAKLVEEAALPEDSDEAELVKKVQALQKQLDEIMSQPKEEILAFLQSRFNWITDSNDFWKDLPPHIQKAANVFGYTQELWDEFSQQLEVFDLPWKSLTPEQQSAAKTLGYNEMTWNGSLEAATPMMAMVDDESKPVIIEMDEDQDDNEKDEEMHDWGANYPSSSSSSEGDNHSDTSSSNDDKGAQDDLIDLEKEPEAIETDYDWGEADSPVEEETATNTSAPKSPVDVYMAPLSPEEYHKDKRLEDDVDEDEFIANFLSDDKYKTSFNNDGSNSNLHHRYVPSDDELELEMEENEEASWDGDDRFNHESKKTEPAGRSKVSDANGDERPAHDGETSPLLGKRRNVERGGLVRRFLGMHTTSSGSSGLSVPSTEEDDDDIDDDDSAKPAGTPFWSRSRQRCAAMAILASGGLVVWIVVRRGSK